ncbi:glycosyltransferase family 2 protein [Telmatocola sphagniphila]|uniref:Glycosyltransferase family 2 protein n=1 Tax=Telmatocola sphagniphila TaxID=1123043 RepID=A0A8E6BB90_9BACT|nr:glycosyltransferase family 2 protein [Telmatocola sphagniphila]QVL34551.1 glycosyltransferase family 2 protein [Telmatocola sphagniphila]
MEVTPDNAAQILHVRVPWPTEKLPRSIHDRVSQSALQSIAPAVISVCIPNWNCKQYLSDCLASLHGFDQGVPFEVIVVDNASIDGAAEMVEDEFPQVRLIRNETNRGFAIASNQAADRAKGKYLFFLNNDTIIPPGTLARLVDFAEAHPEAGLIGPRIQDPQGRLQISYRRKPTVAALLHRTMVFRWSGLLKRVYYDYRRTSFESNELKRVDALMGAAVVMPREIYKTLGGWDPDFRFGGEDLELSVRVGKNRAVYYLPEVEITHYGRISSRLNVTFAAPNVVIGYIHFFRKTGANRISILLYKLVVTLDAPVHLACKLAEYAWRKFTRREEKAAKTRLMIQGLWHFLRRDLLRFWKT